MPHYEQDGIAFDLPDAPTMRQVLRYDSAVETQPDASLYERLWSGACTVVENWRGPVELKPGALDGPMEPGALESVKYACLLTFSWINDVKARATSKNS
jgi:hypothetical protein